MILYLNKYSTKNYAANESIDFTSNDPKPCTGYSKGRG